MTFAGKLILIQTLNFIVYFIHISANTYNIVTYPFLFLMVSDENNATH